MAALGETETYELEIYQLETTDPVIGGPDGIDNLQAKQLANRTNWLKANKQNKDAKLTAISELITAVDKLIYATGADTFSTTTLTAFARTLLDDADAATMRATIGAQPAGSYQASDATLTAIAALTTAADKLIYATGADTFSTTTLTAFARTLLDDADAATMRATIGAGDLSTNSISLTGNGYIKLSNGLILQWAVGANTGPIGAASNVTVNITNPIAFPNACLLAFSDCDGVNSIKTSVVSQSTTAVGVNCVSTFGTYAANPRMIAIGY